MRTHGGAAVATNNAANVNTRGYSRQRVDLRANLGSPIGGVTAGAPRRMADELLSARERVSHGASGRSSARAPALLDPLGPAPTHNPQAMRIWKTCHACPHKPEPNPKGDPK